MKMLETARTCFRLLILLAALAAAHPVDVQAAADQTVSESETRSAGARPGHAVVMVFNRPIIVLRSSVMDHTAAERARATSERIAELIDRKIYGPVTAETRAEGVVVLIGGEFAFLVQPADVDAIAGKTLDETVAESVRFLASALAEAKLQTSAAYLLKAAAKAVGATLVFVVLVWVFFRLYRSARAPVLRFERRAGQWLIARGFFFFSQLANGVHRLVQLAVWIGLLGLASAWLSLCLRWFPYTRPWGEAMQERLLDLLGGVFQSIVRSLPDLVVIAVIIALARGLNGILKGFFSGVENGLVRLEWMSVEAARATRRITTVIVWLFAVVMIYPYIPGSDSSAFKGMSVFVGLLVSLGSAGAVGQFTSGLVLMYSKALRPGEYVRIGDHEGTVESLGFLSTKLRSSKNEEFHVPNTVILGTTIKNYSRLGTDGRLLLHTTVTIGYDAPWRQVQALLIEAARRTPGLCQEPPPFVQQTALSDHYVEYQINAGATNPADRFRLLSALHANIQDQFNTYGVQIMSPHYEADKDRPVIVPKENWYAPPAAPAPIDTPSAAATVPPTAAPTLSETAPERFRGEFRRN